MECPSCNERCLDVIKCGNCGNVVQCPLCGYCPACSESRDYVIIGGATDTITLEDIENAITILNEQREEYRKLADNVIKAFESLPDIQRKELKKKVYIVDSLSRLDFKPIKEAKELPLIEKDKKPHHSKKSKRYF